MNLLSINLQGSKVRRKRCWVKEMCFEKGVQFVGIQETKMTHLELFRIKSLWGNYNFDYACSLARGFLGGILSIWDPNSFVKDQIWCGEYYVIVKGKWNHSSEWYFMVNIYGPQHIREKVILWDFLLSFINNNAGRFIFFGDWNEVRQEGDRKGTIFNSQNADRFNSFIEQIDDIPDLRLVALSKRWSDHTPLLVFKERIDYGPQPFKCFNSWKCRNGFDEIVKQSWLRCNQSTRFDMKLKLVKADMKGWIKEVKSAEVSRVVLINSKLEEIDEAIELGSASPECISNRGELMNELLEINRMEDMDLAQKSRVKWGLDGDENSGYFHALLKQRRRSDNIQGILINGEWVVDPSQVKQEFFAFYRDKYLATEAHIEFPVLQPQYVLSLGERNLLENTFTEDEVKSAVWSYILLHTHLFIIR
ncbi:uncharacterized protein [Rutidosis leptorrhynchoides]|uniref:uncharacterized protein n=1 Tax=Rutidosis leptorrhynchoides TaxID=125765 RepID=UPI003A990CC6